MDWHSELRGQSGVPNMPKNRINATHPPGMREQYMHTHMEESKRTMAAWPTPMAKHTVTMGTILDIGSIALQEENEPDDRVNT